jgi:hypothetical protein
VEGRDDERLVRDIIEAAGFPQERVAIRVADGKYALTKLIKEIPMDRASEYAALIDLDESSIPDAIAHARKQLGNPPIEVFCCVPEAEAWLFADDELALSRCSQDAEAINILKRISLPEEIPNPKDLARQLFGPPTNWGFCRNINIQRATARSPSLRSFLLGFGRLLGASVQTIEESTGRSISRSVLANLVAEVIPSNTIVWRTASGDTYTAAQIRQHIEQGSPLGQQYASDLLRISRDFLRRMANRKEPG